MKTLGLFFIGFCLVFVSGCGEEQTPTHQQQKVLTPISDSTSFSNSVTVYNNKQGLLGLFDVPEMLVLSIMDSAHQNNVAAQMGRDYDRLQEDILLTGAEVNGPGGTINYNNRPDNFKFETIACIKRIPGKQPKYAKIVILESGPMLIFNFYGSYQNLFAAYDKLKRYCKENKLVACGPMREFYLTDPQLEKDQNKWLTRIMLPVMPIPED